MRAYGIFQHGRGWWNGEIDSPPGKHWRRNGAEEEEE